MAAHPAYIDGYVGTRDITMHHTVLDIVKMNPLLRAQITNAVGAICGMVEMTLGTDFRFDKPCVAISSFSFGEMAVQAALPMLEEAGFTPIVCHAQGKGDRAMEEMIRDGAFQGVIDLVEMKAIFFEGDKGEKVRIEAIPEEYAEAAKAGRACWPSRG